MFLLGRWTPAPSIISKKKRLGGWRTKRYFRREGRGANAKSQG